MCIPPNGIVGQFRVAAQPKEMVRKWAVNHPQRAGDVTSPRCRLYGHVGALRCLDFDPRGQTSPQTCHDAATLRAARRDR